MTLAFVTSLRHPQNSADYASVERLLEATLRSVTAQTHEDHVVVVVGNVAPSFPLPPRTRFVQVDFPPPSPPDGPHMPREHFVRDKGTKIGIGMLAAAEVDPSFAMIFDADDFVSRGLAQHVADHPDGPGWYVQDGWMYSAAGGAYRRQSDFHRTCGTSLVVPFGAYGVPRDLPLTATQDEVLDAYGETLHRALGAHRDAVTWFAGRGVHLEPLPFRGAVYHVDTGENHSGKSLTGIARPLGRTVAEEYGIPRSTPWLPSVWQSVGPRAVLDSATRTARRTAHRVLPGRA